MSAYTLNTAESMKKYHTHIINKANISDFKYDQDLIRQLNEEGEEGHQEGRGSHMKQAHDYDDEDEDDYYDGEIERQSNLDGSDNGGEKQGNGNEEEDFLKCQEEAPYKRRKLVHPMSNNNVLNSGHTICLSPKGDLFDHGEDKDEEEGGY